MLQEKKPDASRALITRVVDGALSAMSEIEDYSRKEVETLMAMLAVAIMELGGSLEVTFDTITRMQLQGPKPTFHIDHLNRKTVITCSTE